MSSDDPNLLDLLHHTALSNHIIPPNLDSTASSSYIDQLISLPIASLVKEPSLISNEATLIESELTNLCYREYSTFLSVHRCSTAVQTALDDFESSLVHLLDSVPVLEDECRTFVNKTTSLSRNRNRSILVQEHQDKLLDLLEIPRLMETCVRNGYYHEAMELSAHAHSLPQDNRLVVDVLKEVQGVTQLVTSQLLSLLREPAKLPTVMKTIGYLRRIGLDDTLLGLAFLSGRLDNFRHQLLAIEKDKTEPARYLRKYIDLFREHVYDILSQYSAIFGTLHVSFAGQCVSELVHLVATYVPKCDTPSLSSILIQLGYCSLSFARIGLDFGPLIAAPFADTILAGYSHAVGAASDKLGAALREAVQVPAPLHAVMISSLSGVAAFPPIALFVNENLGALNGLRLLAPSALARVFSTTLESRLEACTAVMVEFLQESLATPTRPKHSRTPSSPRAHLLRRNTETQLAPNVRATKRKEDQRIALSMGTSWISVVELLQTSLASVFGTEASDSDVIVQGLRNLLDTLHVEEETNGTVDATPPQAVIKAARPIDPPLDVFSSPLQNGNASEHIKKPIQEPTTPPQNHAGIVEPMFTPTNPEVLTRASVSPDTPLVYPRDEPIAATTEQPVLDAAEVPPVEVPVDNSVELQSEAGAAAPTGLEASPLSPPPSPRDAETSLTPAEASSQMADPPPEEESLDNVGSVPDVAIRLTDTPTASPLRETAGETPTLQSSNSQDNDNPEQVGVVPDVTVKSTDTSTASPPPDTADETPTPQSPKSQNNDIPEQVASATGNKKKKKKKKK